MYLGIDLGTSSVKTVLFGRDQRLLAQASAPLTVSRPRPGWSEQDPADWWAAVEATVAAVARQHSLAGLRGIGLSGQMHGAVCLDHDDRVVRPAILWNDGRAAAECAAIEAAFPRSREVAGNIAMPGFTAPKLAWMRKHEPEVFQHVDSVLLP
jgi:xylulokinase